MSSNVPEDDDLQALIDDPRESLGVELKLWLTPSVPEDKAKIAKAAIAFRNYNGGKLIIGFDNATLQPNIDGAPIDVRATYDVDTIQGIVSHYSSEPFSIKIEFRERGGIEFPIIIIPSGVQTIVANQRDLSTPDGSLLLRQGEVYFRTLNSNNTPSSAKANWKDWPAICQIIFDNREADIGRFFRRHLTGISADVIQGLAIAFGTGTTPQPHDEDRLLEFMNQSKEKFFSKLRERDANPPNFGCWEAAFLIQGNIPEHNVTRDFLRMLDARNPRHTGWPIWRNSENSSNGQNRPYVEDHMWESLSYNINGDVHNHIDFIRINPNGLFYSLRALEDDISGSNNAPEPMEGLDFTIVIWRVSEAISVGLSYARAMGCEPEYTNLIFSFRWDHLQGREYIHWGSRDYILPTSDTAHQSEVLSSVTIPLDTPQSALGTFVKNVLDRLFVIFGGYELSQENINLIVSDALSRRF